MSKGIDVSKWNGIIDFEAVKNNGVEFAIVKAGSGRLTIQEDPRFKFNYDHAREAGLKVGAYWYSYAESLNDAKREAEACLEVLDGRVFDLPVFYDVEERYQFDNGRIFIDSIIMEFCEKIKAGGYTPGLYMSYSPLMSHVSENVRNMYDLWVAQYNTKCSYDGPHMIWQYSAEGSVSGIYGRVDMNEGYFDIDQPITKSVRDIAHEVIAGLWGNGNDRLERLTNAGYDYAEIQTEVNKIMSRKSVTEIAREVIAGKWGNGDDRKTRLENAGYYYWEIQSEVNRILSGGR